MTKRIRVRRAKRLGKKPRISETLDRLEGPYLVKVALEMYVKGHAITLDRSYRIDCPDRVSVEFVRRYLRATINELESLKVIEPIAGQDEGTDAA